MRDLPISVSFRTSRGETTSTNGRTISIDTGGLSCSVAELVPLKRSFVSIDVYIGTQIIQLRGKVAWSIPTSKSCGIKLIAESNLWTGFFEQCLKDGDEAARIIHPNRRGEDRRQLSLEAPDERRKGERRFSMLVESSLRIGAVKEKPKAKIPKPGTFSPSDNRIDELRHWLEAQTGNSLKNIGTYSEDNIEFRGKIENPIGVAHTPIGIAGPLKINGTFANGEFYIPMATTEGALVTSYSLGAHIISRSGGANVRLIKDELRVGPVFVFRNLKEATVFETWLKINFQKIKTIAESTSNHLKLLECKVMVDGRRVNVNFHYDTGDAMGMNMACRATEHACQMILQAVHPEEFWLRSNLNANKKATAYNFINGYGKTVTADVTIPRKLIQVLDTTPEKMQRYVYRTLLSDTHAVMLGANGHFANAITAMFIACGQDVASIANSHLGVSTCEVTADGSLYFSAYLSCLLVGTVGGGTEFGTSRESLGLLGCSGPGKAKKFAEIVAATALAGEISVCASIVNGTYVHAHESLGRNRPQAPMRKKPYSVEN